MKIPDYLTYFYRKNQKLFEVLTDLEESEALNILKKDSDWRGDNSYFYFRKKQENYLKKQFIEKGGNPLRDHPIYMILGDSPTSKFDLNNDYDYHIKVPLSLFNENDISFTYPDSLYKVPKNELDKLDLERNPNPKIYKINELKDIISSYKVYYYNNHYIEAQIWNCNELKKYVFKNM